MIESFFEVDTIANVTTRIPGVHGFYDTAWNSIIEGQTTGKAILSGGQCYALLAGYEELIDRIEELEDEAASVLEAWQRAVEAIGGRL